MAIRALIAAQTRVGAPACKGAVLKDRRLITDRWSSGKSVLSCRDDYHMEIDDLPEREKAKTASSGMAFAESLSSPLSAIGLKRSMLRSKNLTFLLGAGFSHSWDNRFPTGSRLFHFRRDEWQAQAPAVADFIRL